MFEAAADRVLGPDVVTPAPQSLGGEDFAWYLESIPGALARLGTRTPGSADDFDIHQPTFDVDERAIGIGVKLMAATALTAMCAGTTTTTTATTTATATATATAAEPMPGAALA
jgi:metal-dependent amidase/aminoacylase/carboxypeptidase family protein